MTTYTQLQTTRLKHYRLKDKKVTIWQQYEGKDRDGNSVSYWKKLKTVWAYYRQTSGREVALAKLAQLEQEEDAVFVTNYYEWLNDTGFKITYKGRVYNISRIDNFTDEQRELEIYAIWNHNYTEADLEEQARDYDSGSKLEE